MEYFICKKTYRHPDRGDLVKFEVIQVIDGEERSCHDEFFDSWEEAEKWINQHQSDN